MGPVSQQSILGLWPEVGSCCRSLVISAAACGWGVEGKSQKRDIRSTVQHVPTAGAERA